ncbi:hypothetical protein [Desulfoluna spongiiphila]|uniref:hypothetical protein n=1 Tax=Desulfoluna spongiiphila TaxID=419481 RepID=UPI001258B0CF|nr:hypothetical protein [Desulfoluna spongiiphila]VVS92237.1 hypothetical protein DBB_18050 [Desulfoluna spongiiphila]
MTQIELDVSRHCIASEVKRLHNRRISNYFKGRGDKDFLEPEIALLARALEELDLPALRGRHPRLAGGEAVAVVLSGGEGMPLALTVEGEPLDLDGFGRV